jgi:hypothetical protein
MKQLHCVANNSEIFQFKKDSVEMFSAYMQEVNLKYFTIPIYFTYISLQLLYSTKFSKGWFTQGQ